jgi:hypothetical protein
MSSRYERFVGTAGIVGISIILPMLPMIEFISTLSRDSVEIQLASKKCFTLCVTREKNRHRNYKFLDSQA